MAGMWEFKRQNTFGAAAFTTYGALLGLTCMGCDSGRWGDHAMRACHPSQQHVRTSAPATAMFVSGASRP